jgi:hypothetical protein
MYLKISANREFFNPKERLKTLLFAPRRLAPHLHQHTFTLFFSSHFNFMSTISYKVFFT